MKFFLDTEFIEDGKTIDLISIGIVREDGESVYYQNRECDFSKASDWVRRNVLLSLPHFDIGKWVPNEPFHRRNEWRTREEIKDAVRSFVGYRDDIEFWGYYADYDWVVLCQLFGTMMQLPSNWPKYCRDLKQLADYIGDLDGKRIDLNIVPNEGEHNALNDAKWNKAVWEYLTSGKT